MISWTSSQSTSCDKNKIRSFMLRIYWNKYKKSNKKKNYNVKMQRCLKNTWMLNFARKLYKEVPKLTNPPSKFSPVVEWCRKHSHCYLRSKRYLNCSWKLYRIRLIFPELSHRSPNQFNLGLSVFKHRPVSKLKQRLNLGRLCRMTISLSWEK